MSITDCVRSTLCGKNSNQSNLPSAKFPASKCSRTSMMNLVKQISFTLYRRIAYANEMKHGKEVVNCARVLQSYNLFIVDGTPTR